MLNIIFTYTLPSKLVANISLCWLEDITNEESIVWLHYIYAVVRCFYPTLHISSCFSWKLNPHLVFANVMSTVWVVMSVQMPLFYPPLKHSCLQLMIRTDSGLILPHLLFSCNPLFLGNVNQITDLWLQPSFPPPLLHVSSSLEASIQVPGTDAPLNRSHGVKWRRDEIPYTLYQNGMNWKDCYATEMFFSCFEISSLLLQLCYVVSAWWFSDG